MKSKTEIENKIKELKNLLYELETQATTEENEIRQNEKLSTLATEDIKALSWVLGNEETL